jgi:YVTN family beta-propeller protein
MSRILAVIFFTSIILAGCKHDKEEVPEDKSQFPEEISNILIKKCATSGCHNDQSKGAAGGLSMETWEHLFEGGSGGAAVIPFRPDYSTLMYFVNHDSILTLPQLTPTMPVNGAALNADELETLRNWITNGAPDKNGYIKFSDNPTAKKFYVANQGCDVVTVFDCSTLLAERVISVGSTPFIESPHMIKVSPDNQYWYVCFTGGAYFQKYRVSDNTLAGEVNIGMASWNTFSISSDNQKAYIIDFDNGKIATVDLNTMTAQFINGFGNPHGSALNETNDTLFVTAQLASYLFKIPVNDPVDFEIIDLVGTFPSPAAELEPHEVALSPAGDKIFVTCQESDEVRVIQRSNDSVVAVIPVGLFPVEMAFSHHHPYMFVTCLDDVNANPSQRSSVAVINYLTNTLITKVYAGYQSHGVVVDDENGRVYIANRNLDIAGPLPHHTSICGGRNGYVSAIDMSTLQLVPGHTNMEVAVDPYGLGIMH